VLLVGPVPSHQHFVRRNHNRLVRVEVEPVILAVEEWRLAVELWKGAGGVRDLVTALVAEIREDAEAVREEIELTDLLWD
jgi:hypothetical protein